MDPVYDVMTLHLTDHFGVPHDLIRPDATFKDMELDSLALVEFATLMEDTLGVSLPEEHIGSTLGEVAAYLTEARAAAAATGAEASA
ncbi:MULTISPECIES: acyl carrier protein [unclassified Streptomyces]|uniref:acyl carrier protein n=1 Tax=unclassified Streptomyces TaxID=2593676 RepID=UPI0022B6E9BD|nr:MULTISPECIES: acyl carrier protein [unclassified Streptomyces]MCZ7416827.1 acyl carrier protein [Streptomyces sp. WMMC897]MCZ7433355.1 acyl carrier protein [Streptomyces sp. WMMC1477]